MYSSSFSWLSYSILEHIKSRKKMWHYFGRFEWKCERGVVHIYSRNYCDLQNSSYSSSFSFLHHHRIFSFYSKNIDHRQIYLFSRMQSMFQNIYQRTSEWISVFFLAGSLSIAMSIIIYQSCQATSGYLRSGEA